MELGGTNKQQHGHIEVFSRSCDDWVRVLSLSRRHEGFDAIGKPLPARLVAEFHVPGLGLCRKATTRGSGLLRYVRPESCRTLEGTRHVIRNCLSSENYTSLSGSESELEHDPDFSAMHAGVSSENPVSKGLQGMGIQSKMAEMLGDRFQSLVSLESALQWLLDNPQATQHKTTASQAARTSCVYQDIVLCEPDGNDGIYRVGGTSVGDCKNAEHQYCYDCLWRAIRENVRDNAIPRCPGSTDKQSHAVAGGCGGHGHEAANCDCGSCARTFLSQTQVEDIMTGYFTRVQEPSAEEVHAFALQSVRDNGGSVRWQSRKLEQLFLEHAVRQQGGIKCPDLGCQAMVLLPSSEYSGPVQCPSECCRFHVDPFCSRCLQIGHQWTSCDDILGISAEWLRWCREGRRSALNQAAANNAAYQRQLDEYNRQRDQRQRDLEIAEANFKALQEDEAYKQNNCKRCPECQRVVQKTAGCDDMVCGRDWHGGNQQQGCGAQFNWNNGIAYRAQTGERRHSERELIVPQRAMDTRHFFLDGSPWHCEICGDAIQGPLIQCINCPRFAACIRCDSTHDLPGHLVRCKRGVAHRPGHIFRVLMESLAAGDDDFHGDGVLYDDGPQAFSWDEDAALARALAEFSGSEW
eukprot:TRINITY_DN102835_c0_g1_i1.p1 TRINITY_DN102835_c0_g1~~TRINITY_DN102835_c0_g1_i1.p1  ORF type:complete len:646 (-),score=92.78 TRINITY_DN102835_c0_g1_i1:93-1997(-)